MSASPEVETPFLPCQACQLHPAQVSDIFCSGCRTLIQSRTDGPLKLARVWRVARTFLTESLFGIFTGLLVISSIGAASSGTVTMFEVIRLVVLFAIFVAPIIASIHTWMVRPSIQHAALWGWIGTARVLFLTFIMLFVVVIGDLRYTTFPKPIFLLGLIAIEWLLGVGIARWQERYLPPLAQRRAEWRAWSWRGWTLACGIHFGISLFIPNYDIGLWLGIAAGVVIYELVAQLMIMRFAQETAIAKELQKEYQYIWYNV
jgi:hypothetical protein